MTEWTRNSLDIFEPTYCMGQLTGSPLLTWVIPYKSSTSQQLPQVSCHSPVFTAAQRKTGIGEHWISAAIQLCRLAVAATIKVCFTLLYLHTFNWVCIPWCQALKARDGCDEKGKYGQEWSHTLPFSKLSLYPYPSGFGHGKQKM